LDILLSWHKQFSYYHCFGASALSSFFVLLYSLDWCHFFYQCIFSSFYLLNYFQFFW
jgi:hypothetical protein